MRRHQIEKPGLVLTIKPGMVVTIGPEISLEFHTDVKHGHLRVRIHAPSDLKIDRKNDDKEEK